MHLSTLRLMIAKMLALVTSDMPLHVHIHERIIFQGSQVDVSEDMIAAGNAFYRKTWETYNIAFF